MGSLALDRDLSTGDAACATTQCVAGAVFAVNVGRGAVVRHYFPSLTYPDALLRVYDDHERTTELFVRQGPKGAPWQLTFAKL